MSTFNFHKTYPPNNPHIVDKIEKVCKLLGLRGVENRIDFCGMDGRSLWKDKKRPEKGVWTGCGKARLRDCHGGAYGV